MGKLRLNRCLECSVLRCVTLTVMRKKCVPLRNTHENGFHITVGRNTATWLGDAHSLARVGGGHFYQGCNQFGPSWNHCMRECPCRHTSRQEDANFGFAQALWVAWGWNGRRTGAKHGGGHLEWPHSCGHPLLTSNLLRWRWPSHGSLGERPSNF